MSNYTKSTNFATKDNLPSGDPLKIVKGTEIDTEFNNIATAIATKSDIFASGTALLFQQTAAPTGWTKQTTHDNKALRVVSGTASSGGTVAFTTAFASQAVAGSLSVSVGSTTLTQTQMPSHGHSTQIATGANGSPGGSTIYSVFDLGDGQGTTATGGGGSHTHSGSGTFTGTAINLAVQYVDVIIATKD